MDTMDVAGDNQLDIEHTMKKQRLTLGGDLLGLPISSDVMEAVSRVLV